MFSSNQILQISGSLHDGQLKQALEFVLKYDDIDLNHICYQITEDGRYCLGWAPLGNPKPGWSNYPFEFDIDIISLIIKQHLSNQKTQHDDMGDGSYRDGFLMQVTYNYCDGIKSPFYGFVSFEPYVAFYAK